ncbi:MAG TPA: hypothetical protein VF834_24930 [Streptosporangiaceae bacterium]
MRDLLQATRALAEDVSCAGPAGEPDPDAVLIARISEGLSAHFHLCAACDDADLSRG